MFTIQKVKFFLDSAHLFPSSLFCTRELSDTIAQSFYSDLYCRCSVFLEFTFPGDAGAIPFQHMEFEIQIIFFFLNFAYQRHFLLLIFGEQ